MPRLQGVIAAVILLTGIMIGGGIVSLIKYDKKIIQYSISNQQYWFVLHRTESVEYLYYGIPSDKANSKLIKLFYVKTGIPEVRPTPLPQLAGRNYWLITKKYSSDNPETAPYFLELDVPGIEEEPFGPSPYTECNGQCNWILPGSFGLHGVNGDTTRLGKENLGSSGCIRHTDQDITFLYQLLDPDREQIRYYIQDI